MPINSENLASLTDADVIDQNGDKVGGVGQIYLDDASGQPAWVSVKSGLFGLRESFAPLGGAEVVNGNIQLPFAKDFIKDSPRIDAENHLDDSQQALLYDYYGVERSAAPADGTGGGADRTAAFGSEQVAEDLHDGRSDGEDEREAEQEAEEGEGQGLTEYAGTQAGADPAPEAGGPVAAGAPAGAAASEAAAIGAAAAAAGSAPARSETAHAGVAPDDAGREEGRPITAEDAAAAGGNAEWAETQRAHYQQANPAAQADWAAEESPEEPVATDWSVPATDPADEEPTRVSRSGYSPDRPAAHSGAYEGHAAPTAAAAAAPGDVDPAAAAAGDAGTGDLETEGLLRDDLATGEPGAEPVVDEPAVDEPVVDDAVTGAAHQTGTGYPSTAEEPEGLGGADAAVAGAAAAGAAAGGIAASDTETTAYEVPGAELGKPIADTDSGAELAVDTEDPADGATLPAEDATMPEDDATMPEDDATMPAGTDAGVDDTGEPEAFGAQGYHPDRDGTDMTDEERARLNDARGAL